MNGGRRRRDPVVDLERDLLARLGLGTDTTPERVEAAHDAVVDFLARAPSGLRAWARTQAAAADTAYALLSDPIALADVANRASPGSAPAESAAKRAEAAAVGSSPVRVATAPRPSRPPRGTHIPARSGSVDELDELIAEVTPSAHREEVERPPSRTASRSAAPATAASAPSWRLPVLRLAAVVAAAVAVVGIAVYVYNDRSAPIASAADATAAPTPTATLDEAQVASLMSKVQANPKDTDALMGLGDAFFQVGQYKVAADWLAKVVAIDSKNVRALLALGAADYNAGSTTDAEKHWKQVVALDAKNVEAHYDLGFLYLQKQPPDMDGMRREWQTVVDLAPGTEVAQSVQTHLGTVASPAASGSASPSPAATGGGQTAAPSAHP